MANVTVIVREFEDLILKVTPFEDLKLRPTEQEQVTVIVPVESEGEQVGFDYTLEFDL